MTYGKGSKLCIKHKLGLVEAVCPYCRIEKFESKLRTATEALESIAQSDESSTIGAACMKSIAQIALRKIGGE